MRLLFNESRAMPMRPKPKARCWRVPAPRSLALPNVTICYLRNGGWLRRWLIRQSDPPHQISKSRVPTQHVECGKSNTGRQLGVLLGVRLLQILKGFVAIAHERVNQRDQSRSSHSGIETQLQVPL